VAEGERPMKIRSGFVSNSSSSSFIIGFKEMPKNFCELKDLMFGEYAERTFYYEEAYDVFDVARVVFEDLKAPVTKDDLIREVASGWVNGIAEDYDDELISNSEFQKWTNDEKQDYWKKREDKREKQAAEYVDNFLKGKEDLTFFIVEYSDNSGQQEAMMEHGDIFRRLPHVQISHH
jgi:hypothetical protein